MNSAARHVASVFLSFFLLLYIAISFAGCDYKAHLSAQSNEDENESKETIMSRHDYRIIAPSINESLYFAGEKIPTEIFYVFESIERELLVNVYWHSSTLLILKRSERWFPVIEPILKENGIPDDFKFLSMIESNLTNTRSPAGASGFWQFMEGTAKEYQMEVNADVDERYHIEKSTHAACRYLNKAYEKYKSWALVAAAYNAGTKRIDGFLAEQKASSYFDLLMAEETERYLYRIMAMKIIYANPAEFGFYPMDEKSYLPYQFKTVKVQQTITDLAAFAKNYKISYKLLKIFNPWLRSNKLVVSPGSSYEIKIPLEPFNRTHEVYEISSDTK